MKNKNIRVYKSGAKFKGKGKYTKSLRFCTETNCNASLGWKRGRYKAYCRSCIRKIKLTQQHYRKLDISELNKPGWRKHFIGVPAVVELEPPRKLDMSKIRQPGWRHEFLQNRLFVEDHKPSKEQLGKVFQEFAPWNENDYLKAKERINNIKQ